MIVRLFYIVFVFMLILVGIVGISHYKNERTLAEWLKAPSSSGQVVVVASENTFLVKRGTGPVGVLIFTGLGSIGLEWIKVAEELTKESSNFTVVIVDRPGYTWSSPLKGGGGPNQIQDQILERTAAALATLKFEPQVVVGHSLGAHFAEAFARKFPDGVKAALFIDPLANPNDAAIAGPSPDLQIESVHRFLDQREQLERSLKAAQVGILRFMNMTYYDVPREVRPDVLNNLCHEVAIKAMLDEYAAAFSSVPSTPLSEKISAKVIFHSPKENIELIKQFGFEDSEAQLVEKTWRASADRFAHLNSKTQSEESHKSLMAIHITDPQLVAKEIRERLVK